MSKHALIIGSDRKRNTTPIDVFRIESRGMMTLRIRWHDDLNRKNWIEFDFFLQASSLSTHTPLGPWNRHVFKWKCPYRLSEFRKREILFKNLIDYPGDGVLVFCQSLLKKNQKSTMSGIENIYSRHGQRTTQLLMDLHIQMTKNGYGQYRPKLDN